MAFKEKKSNSLENQETLNQQSGIPIFTLWSKYEDIAMHFNDLIVKIRIQALGVVAAISSVVAILAKNDAGMKVQLNYYNWELIFPVFLFLSIFWVAIWILDFFYYNRLLEGAVKAIIKIEKESKNGKDFINEIQFSAVIEDSVTRQCPGKKSQCSGFLYFLKNTWFNFRSLMSIGTGKTWFYRLVLFPLLGVCIISGYFFLSPSKSKDKTVQASGKIHNLAINKSKVK